VVTLNRGARVSVPALVVLAGLLAVPAAAYADDPSMPAPPPAHGADDYAPTGEYGLKGEPIAPAASRAKVVPRAKGASLAMAAKALAAADEGAAHMYYNTGLQNVTAGGVYANVYIGKPWLDSIDSHTLAELAVIKKMDDGSRQIVEVGWNVDRVVNGDDEPHLFVFSWINGVGQCYNGCGFVNYKGDDQASSVQAGGKLTEGDIKQFGIQYNATSETTGDWWIAYDKKWVGYFPGELWTKASPSVSFTESTQVQAFGEVAADNDWPCTDMGTAKPGSGGAGAAYFSSVSLYNSKSTTSLTQVIQPSGGWFDTFYTMNWPGTPPSVRSFYYGGGGSC
jgi:hypothetical protein